MNGLNKKEIKKNERKVREKKSSMEIRAENEVKIACVRKNPNRKEELYYIKRKNQRKGKEWS